MEYKDYYATLGVPKDAKEDAIKLAYRKLARKYHPDVSKEKNAEEKFKEVQEAYEVLKDPKKRAQYDQLGSQWQHGQEFHPPPGGQTHTEFHGGFNGGDFSDFFSSIFGGDIPREHFHQRRQAQRAGQDEHAKIVISLEDAFHGATKTIHFQSHEIDAHGRIHPKTRTLKMNIPAGVISGQQLRLAKQGSPGIGNAPPGDLYLEIEIAPHKVFTIQGKDIYLSLPVTPSEAALGAKISVPTLGGIVEMKLAENSQTGQKLRLKGRGLPSKSEAGDQYVVLQIMTPPIHNAAQRELYEKMAKDFSWDPRAHLFAGAVR